MSIIPNPWDGIARLYRPWFGNDEIDRPPFRDGGEDSSIGLDFARGRITPERRRRMAQQTLEETIFTDEYGDKIDVTYETLSDLQVRYYEMLDAKDFFAYLQSSESTFRELSGDAGAWDQVKAITERYDVLDDLDIEDFEFKDKYSFFEMTALPATFTPGQTAALNARFEMLGIYDYFDLRPPKFVDDPLDPQFVDAFKYMIAESVGRNTTMETLLNERAERQMAAIEEGLASFDDRTIAIELDKMAMQLRGKPLTAQEFEAIKSSIAMFDEDITDEEMTGGIERQLDILQQPSRIAMSDEAGLNFQRDAEVALRNYFEDDERTRWFQVQRNSAAGMNFDAITSGRFGGESLEDVPAIIEEQESTQL